MSLTPKQCIQLNQAVFSLANAYRSRMQRESPEQETGLSLADRSVLMVLGQYGRQNARQLASRMDINPGTISVYVQRLVEKELVDRAQDQADRRTWWLNLTSTGERAYKETIRGTVEYTRDFLQPLDDEEATLLSDLLLRVAASLGYDWGTP